MKNNNLTDREREIANLVAQDKKPREIAEELVIAKRTVYVHLDHIAQKLELDDRKTATVADAIKDRK